MAEEQFSDFVARERDRLGAERKAVLTQQRELQAKLAGIDREFQAIDAYAAAKTGKAVRQTPIGHNAPHLTPGQQARGPVEGYRRG